MFSLSPKQVACIHSAGVQRSWKKKNTRAWDQQMTPRVPGPLFQGPTSRLPSSVLRSLLPLASSSRTQSLKVHFRPAARDLAHFAQSPWEAARATHPGALGQVVAAQRMVKIEADHVTGGQGEVLSHGSAAAGTRTGRLVERASRSCQDPASVTRKQERGAGRGLTGRGLIGLTEDRRGGAWSGRAGLVKWGGF